MFEGAMRYIEQQFPKPVFSEIFYFQSIAAPVPPRSIISVDFTQVGARGIFFQFLYVAFQAGGGGTITFTDQFNQALFPITDTVGDFSPAVVPIALVKKGPQSSITCSGGGVTLYPFAVSLQYIM